MKERNYKKHELCTKGKFILRREEDFMSFRIKEKFMSWISGSKNNLFNAVSWYRDDHSIVFTRLG